MKRWWQKMSKVSNEVKLIVALWKEKLEKRKGILVTERMDKIVTSEAQRELDGIDFAENRLVEIISDLEEGKL